MPKKNILWPHRKKSDSAKEEYVKAEIEKIRAFSFKQLDEAISINNRVFKNICIFSVMDCFAQEYFNYPTSGLAKAFCDFVLKFQDYCDYLEMVEPVTLFYDYEPNIKMVEKTPESGGSVPQPVGAKPKVVPKAAGAKPKVVPKAAGAEPEVVPQAAEAELEVSLKDIGDLDGKTVSEIIRMPKADEIMAIIRRDEGRKVAKTYRRNHKIIHLIYKMRSKAVHELSRMGNENKWDIEDGRSEPFYRDMVRLYEYEGNVVSENFYELIIPSQFIYELAKNTLSNFFDYCLKENRHPFENNTNFKRPVELSWRD